MDPKNFGECKTNFYFSWHQASTLVTVAPDSRFISFEMMISQRNADYSIREIKQVPMSRVRRDKHPQFFVPSSYADVMASLSQDGASTELLTFDDPYDIEIFGDTVNGNAASLSFLVLRCDSRLRDDCATDKEL